MQKENRLSLGRMEKDFFGCKGDYFSTTQINFPPQTRQPCGDVEFYTINFFLPLIQSARGVL